MIQFRWNDHFIKLGDSISRFIKNPDERLLNRISDINPWFIRSYVLTALNGLLIYLNPENIDTWLSKYDLTGKKNKNIGIIMPGNVPLAGFHDLLCVLISGNNAFIRPSHLDTILIEFIIEQLQNINPLIRDRVVLCSDVGGVDALIATGSDNSARYFKYHYNNLPKIIRSNRSSCCILEGTETTTELNALSNDIFLYFGLGCRNVSKIYLPKNYQIHTLVQYFSGYSWITNHPKYNNNYIHNRSQANLIPQSFIDSGYFLLSENTAIVSPVSVIYHETYSDKKDLHLKIETNKKKIQCIISHPGVWPQSVKFGDAQFPQLWDYSDGVDTLNFLINL